MVTQHSTSRDCAPAIRATGLSKSYHTLTVLDEVDLSVRPGETVAILGPSGSGKSTLCRVLAGLEPPDRGTIELGGLPWVYCRPGEPPRRHRQYAQMRLRIGMVFQHYTLFPQLTVRQNVALGPRKVLGVAAAEIEHTTETVLRRVGLWDKRDAFPAHLSGGQQQRAAIARELAMHRQIIMFDEATSALDPELVGEVLAVIRELVDGGLTVLIVTHEMRFAADVADRIVFLDSGRVVETGTPAEFFQCPQQERTRAFLSRVSF